MTFNVTSDDKVTMDEQDVVRKLHHPRHPYQVETPMAADEGASVRQVADAYVKDVMHSYNLNESMADNLTGAVSDTGVPGEAPMLHYAQMAKVGKLTTVAYTQTVLGLPVWEAGLTVKALRSPSRVIGSQSSVQRDVDVQLPSPDASYLPGRVDAKKLAALLKLDETQMPTINSSRLLIYRLDAEDRGNGIRDSVPDDETNMHVCCPTLEVPDLPADFTSNKFYVVTEVLFSLTLSESGEDNWGAFIDPKTGSVLRLDVFVGCVDGQVFLRDPPTKNGDQTIRPDSATSVLDNLRDRVVLDALKPSDPQVLRSEFVHVRVYMAPYIEPPTQPAGSHFLYSVPTDEFAAVNAFYHCDRLFRMMQEMGFDVRDYFDGTSFPVPVDHRVSYGGTPNVVNASAPGDVQRDGSNGFRFALVQRDTNIGMAVDWRVTLHEFGHAILWDHVHSPNFLFAHSPGDSLAAILNDPDSKVLDRFRTFPWNIIRRRHDRRVEDGWGWGGRNDNWRTDRAGYLREQILSTTLFRYYRAIGGDHSDVAVRRQASRYVVFMIYTAVGALNHITPPQDAGDFAEELMEADIDTDVFEGLPGKMTHKVIRWAFERQGLYQPRGAPTPTIEPGSAPDVDVYIDDGRGGEYDPRSIFVFSSTDIWNRNTDDGGLEHQQPLLGKSNFLYVRVKNRGTREAKDVVVKAFISTDLEEREWPSKWTALDTATLSAKGTIDPQGERVVGPFEWRRIEGNVVSLLASVSADGDKSSADSVEGSVAAARLTHCDNNIAGRTMTLRNEPPVEPSKIILRTSPNLPIPDVDPAGVVSELSVVTPGLVKQVEVPVMIEHTYVGDLKLSLTSPTGTNVVLYEGSPDDSSDNLSVTFTQQAVTDLTKFEGETALGTWRLHVVDRAGRDTGTLLMWGLRIEVS